MSAQEFVYEAVSADGTTSTGRISGVGERDAVLRLQRQGLVPLSVVPAGGGGEDIAAPAPKASKSFSMPKLDSSTSVSELMNKLRLHLGTVKLKDLIMFSENLAVLLGAGVSLDKALYILTDLAVTGRFRAVVRDVHTRIREGSTLAEAVAAHPKVFPPVFSGMVAAGEKGGILDSVLKRLSEYLNGVQEIREYLTAAMIYPAVLTLTSVGSMLVLLTVVIPKFAVIFEDIGVTLPLATRMMMGMGHFFQNWWWAVLLGILAALAGFRYVIKTPSGRRFVDGLKLRLPMLGPIFVKVETSRLAATMGTLLGNGVAILASLNIVRGGVVQNSVLNDMLGKVYEDLKEGELFSRSLQKRVSFFPSQAVHMIGVGEETGRLDEMLNKVAEIYDKDLRTAVKSFTALVEPLVILVMGLLIGTMVVSMLMAIFSINDVSI